MHLLIASLIFSAAAAAAPEGPPIGFEALLGFDALPILADWPAYQDSSYSRQNINADAGNFLRVEPDGEQVMVDTDGPGVVYRVWSTGVVGMQMSDKCRMRFWLDGEEKPRLDFSIPELFGAKGSRWPFVPPLSVTFESGLGGGEGPCNLSYVPIPFAKHLKVTGRNIMFYHVDYHRLPAGTPVESFTIELAEKHRAVLEKAAEQWKAIPARPGLREGDEAKEIADATLAPGEVRSVRIEGEGAIRGIRLKLASPAPKVLRGLVLEAAFEDEANVCVRAPAGDFFGSGSGEHRFRSLPCGMTEDGYYAWWPMPFRKLAVVALRNECLEPVKVEAWKVSWDVGRQPPGAGTFHARYVENPDIPFREDYHILDVEGRGKLVGCNVTMQNAEKAQGIFFLEGDEKIYADGEKWPSRWLGTGTEDYFNGAYFWNAPDKAVLARPLGGLTFLDWGIGRVCAYRWHFPDCVNFTRSLKLDLEHGGVSDWPSHYASVAYYYLEKPAAQRPLPALADRLPRTPLPAAPAFLCCDLRGQPSLGGRPLERRTFHAIEPEYESDDAALVGKGRPGERAEAEIAVPGDEEYQPVIVVCGGPGFAPLKASIDGKELGEIRPDRPAFTPWIAAEMPPLRLARGTRKLVLEVLDPKGAGAGAGAGTGAGSTAAPDLSVGLVAVQLRPKSPAIGAWWTVGSWPCPKEGGWEKSWEPETNQDPSATYRLPDGHEVRWKEFTGAGVGLGGGDWLVAYGLTYVWSPDARSVALFIGKDDGLKVWVNGEVVFDRNTWSHAWPDQFFATARLKAGWNRVFVKCANWSGGWGFSIRPSDPDRKLRFARRPS